MHTLDHVGSRGVVKTIDCDNDEDWDNGGDDGQRLEGDIRSQDIHGEDTDSDHDLKTENKTIA